MNVLARRDYRQMFDELDTDGSAEISQAEFEYFWDPQLCLSLLA